jgi:hypothetical protein
MIFFLDAVFQPRQPPFCSSYYNNQSHTCVALPPRLHFRQGWRNSFFTNFVLSCIESKHTHTAAVVVVPHNKWAYTSSNEYPTHTQECPPKCDNYTQRLEYNGVVQCFFANESGIDVPRPARASPTGNNDNDGSIQLPLYWKSFGTNWCRSKRLVCGCAAAVCSLEPPHTYHSRLHSSSTYTYYHGPCPQGILGMRSA